MKKTMGHLFQRGGKGNWHIEFTINGHKTAKSLGTADKKEAIKKQKKYAEISLTTNTVEDLVHTVARAKRLVSEKKITIKNTWEEYKNSFQRKQHGEGTLGNHQRRWNRLEKWIEKNHPEVKFLNQITSNIANEFAVWLWEKNITADTFQHHINAFKMIYKNLLDTQVTPFDKIQKDVKEGVNRLGFTPAQIDKIHEAIDEKDFTVRSKPELHLLCWIAQYTGLRLVDAVLLKSSSVDLDKDNIFCTPVKTIKCNRKVSIPINSELREKLAKADLTQEYVLPELAKRYLHSRHGVIKSMLLIFKRAGLTEKQTRDRGMARSLYGFHSFRHTFCITMVNATPPVPVAVLADMMGDNIATVSKYYVKINDESKIKAIQTLSNNKPVSEVEKLTERIATAVKMLESASIDGAIKAELLKILQG